MKKICDTIAADTLTLILVITTIAMLLIGLFSPPLGIIDGSVLIAVGELTAILAILRIGDSGIVTIKHKDTSVQIQTDGDNEKK